MNCMFNSCVFYASKHTIKKVPLHCMASGLNDGFAGKFFFFFFLYLKLNIS